ncbi:signal peptidase I [Microbacterium marinilacus]|uniref:Signal peptidase I n=1 Tax=Microbacterium marinilacus TaxID=415209 RepID=A0ABP7BJ34_9MICO|nr:signal peptidase I [Microbacterium marinilacus]
MSRAREAGRAIVHGLSLGLLGLVLLLGLAVIGVPALVGGTSLTILTGSMSPTLPPGTLIVVKPTPVDEIAVGDIMTYQLESGEAAVVTHRVVARLTDSASGEPRFVTQGDANGSPDAEPVLPVQVRGTVWYAVPWLGWANQAVNGAARQWLVPAAATALFAYATILVLSGVRDRRRRRTR